MNRHKRLPLAGMVVLGLLSVSCGAKSPEVPAAGRMASTAPTSAPAVNLGALAVFENKPAGIRFKYPADWKPEKAQTALLDVAAPPDKSKGYAALSLDVPKLPMHIPGMINSSMVANGYIDDLKKNQIHDAKVVENKTIKMPGSDARQVRCVGHENGKPMTDVAIIIVRHDKVYIFSCDGDPDGLPLGQAALDNAVGTIEWMK